MSLIYCILSTNQANAGSTVCTVYLTLTEFTGSALTDLLGFFSLCIFHKCNLYFPITNTHEGQSRAAELPVWSVSLCLWAVCVFFFICPDTLLSLQINQCLPVEPTTDRPAASAQVSELLLLVLNCQVFQTKARDFPADISQTGQSWCEPWQYNMIRRELVVGLYFLVCIQDHFSHIWFVTFWFQPLNYVVHSTSPACVTAGIQQNMLRHCVQPQFNTFSTCSVPFCRTSQLSSVMLWCLKSERLFCVISVWCYVCMQSKMNAW